MYHFTFYEFGIIGKLVKSPVKNLNFLKSRQDVPFVVLGHNWSKLMSPNYKRPIISTTKQGYVYSSIYRFLAMPFREYTCCIPALRSSHIWSRLVSFSPWGFCLFGALDMFPLLPPRLSPPLLPPRWLADSFAYEPLSQGSEREHQSRRIRLIVISLATGWGWWCCLVSVIRHSLAHSQCK